MRLATKRLIADALLEMVDIKPLCQITVQDIASACEINRGTFYYHYLDKQELINWIFHNDIILPFRKKMEKEDLEGDISYFMLESMYQHRSFYTQAFRMTEQNNLDEYSREEIVENWRIYVDLLIQKTGLSDPPFARKLYTMGNTIALGSSYSLSLWAKNGMQSHPRDMAKQMDGEILPVMKQIAGSFRIQKVNT